MRDLIWVFVGGLVVGMLFEKLGGAMKKRHDESRGSIDKKLGE